MMMFGITGVLAQLQSQQLINNASLLYPFNDGLLLDVIEPNRSVEFANLANIAHPYLFGSKYANTSLVFTHDNGGTQSGFYTQNLSGFSTLGNSGVNYTVEFWASGLYSTATYSLFRITNSQNQTIVSFSVGASNSLNVLFHNLSSNLTFARQLLWNHYALVRQGNTIRVYVNGQLRFTGTVILSFIDMYAVTLSFGNTFFNAPVNTGVNRYNINYFGITLLAKYDANFNPITDTGFEYLYIDLANNTQYLT